MRCALTQRFLLKAESNYWSEIVGTPARPSAVFSHHLIDSRIVANDASAKIGFHGAWRNHIDGNPTRTQLLCQMPRQHFDRSLHRGVDRPSGEAVRVRTVDMLTMRPPSLIRGRSFCVRKKTPLKWTL